MQTKDYKIAVRIDKPTLEKLGVIVQKENISQSEAVRKAIDYFYLDLLIKEKLEKINQSLEVLKGIPQEVNKLETKIEESKNFLKEGILTDIKHTKGVKEEIKVLKKQVLKEADFEDFLERLGRFVIYNFLVLGFLVFLNLIELIVLIKLVLK